MSGADVQPAAVQASAKEVGTKREEARLFPSS